MAERTVPYVWIVDDTDGDRVKGVSRVGVALSVLPTCAQMAAKGLVTKPANASGPLRAVVLAFDLADAFLWKLQKDLKVVAEEGVGGDAHHQEVETPF